MVQLGAFDCYSCIHKTGFISGILHASLQDIMRQQNRVPKDDNLHQRWRILSHMFTETVATVADLHHLTLTHHPPIPKFHIQMDSRQAAPIIRLRTKPAKLTTKVFISTISHQEK